VAQGSPLLAAPNVSEGRDRKAIEAMAGSFEGARLLNVHSDADHGRSVFTLAAPQGDLAPALVTGARVALEAIDLRRHRGLHPHVGAVDVMPVVYLIEDRRGAACAEALTVAARIGGELEVPVFLYGQLATDPSRRERAALREGGPEGLRTRMEEGLSPDFGPRVPERRAGATLVTARPPLVAFNVELATGDVALAKRIAKALRESGGGPAGVRAIGLRLPGSGRAQVSFNLHHPQVTPLAEMVAAVERRAPVAEAELVGLAPRHALAGFPDHVPLRAAEPCTIEDSLRSAGMLDPPREPGA
jgi:glutamate formiminotransferase